MLSFQIRQPLEDIVHSQLILEQITMQILLLGSGGREHALAWKLSQSNLVHHIFVCPGNGGTSREPKTTNLDLPMSDFAKITEWAVANDVRI